MATKTEKDQTTKVVKGSLKAKKNYRTPSHPSADDKPTLLCQKTMKPVLDAIKLLREVVINHDASRDWTSEALAEMSMPAVSKSQLEGLNRSWVIATAGALVHHRLSPSGVHARRHWKDIQLSDLTRIQKDKLFRLIDRTSRKCGFWENDVADDSVLANELAVILEDVLNAFPEAKCGNKPVWNRTKREFSWQGSPIKVFAEQAKVVMAILDKFQQEKWSKTISNAGLEGQLGNALHYLRRSCHPISFNQNGKGGITWTLSK